MAGIYGSGKMPRQKLPYAEKDEIWGKMCIDSAIAMIDVYDNSRRSPIYKKLRNYDLYNGKFDTRDLEYVTNPLGLKGVSYPATMQYYDLVSPNINLLIGEETKRPFTFSAISVNEEAISQKEEHEKETIMQVLNMRFKSIMEGQEPSETLKEQLDKYSTYSDSELRESIANKLLKFFYKEQDLGYKFAKGWEDVLIAAEEVYAIEEVSGEPRMRRINPVEIFFVLDRNSDLIDEADVIVEERYVPIGKIIDEWYDKLDADQIDNIESHYANTYSAKSSTNYYLPPKYYIGDNTPTDISLTYQGNSFYRRGAYDAEGNVRECRITWKSRKKIGNLTFIDPETQQEDTMYVSEAYKIDKDRGDISIEWLWVNEYWEGVKLAEDIYLYTRPKRHQFRSINNMSECKSGYVGTLYNANNSQSVSLIDRLVPWAYLYNIIHYRTELALAKNLGKIALIDRSLIPSDWEVEKWFYYAQSMGIGIVDSYDESKKGERTNTLNQSNQNKVLDLETGSYIQQHISLMEYIERKIDDLSGITRQRKGNVTSSELVGTTERAVVQSSIITEKWFEVHNFTKRRVLEHLIQIAKELYNGTDKRFQYIGDDMAATYFAVNGVEFADSEYGIFVSNSSKDHEGINFLKQQVQTALQYDKMELSQIVDIFNTESLSDIKHKFIAAETARNQNAQAQQEAEIKAQQDTLNRQELLEHEKMDRDDYNKEMDREAKIHIAEIGAFIGNATADSDNNGIPDPIDVGTLALKEQELAFKKHIEERKLALEDKKIDAENKRTQAEKDMQAKDHQNKKEIEHIKNKRPRSTSKKK